MYMVEPTHLTKKISLSCDIGIKILTKVSADTGRSVGKKAKQRRPDTSSKYNFYGGDRGRGSKEETKIQQVYQKHLL